MTIQVLSEKGENHCQTARLRGGGGGAFRYPLPRTASGATDGRCKKPFRAEVVSQVIKAWFDAHGEADRPVNMREMYERLVSEHGYPGSYKSVVRYVGSD